MRDEYARSPAGLSRELGLPLVGHFEPEARFLERKGYLGAYALDRMRSSHIYRGLQRFLDPMTEAPVLWIAFLPDSWEQAPCAVSLAEAAVEVHGRSILAEVGDVHLPPPVGGPESLDAATQRAVESLLECPVHCWGSDVAGIVRCIPTPGGGRVPRPLGVGLNHVAVEQAIFVLSAIPEEVGGWVPPADLVDGVIFIGAFRDHSLPLMSWGVDSIRSSGHNLIGIIAVGPKETVGEGTEDSVFPAAPPTIAAARPAPAVEPPPPRLTEAPALIPKEPETRETIPKGREAPEMVPEDAEARDVLPKDAKTAGMVPKDAEITEPLSVDDVPSPPADVGPGAPPPKPPREPEEECVSVYWASRYGTRPSLRTTLAQKIKALIPWMAILVIAGGFTFWKLGSRLLPAVKEPTQGKAPVQKTSGLPDQAQTGMETAPPAEAEGGEREMRIPPSPVDTLQVEVKPTEPPEEDVVKPSAEVTEEEDRAERIPEEETPAPSEEETLIPSEVETALVQVTSTAAQVAPSETTTEAREALEPPPAIPPSESSADAVLEEAPEKVVTPVTEVTPGEESGPTDEEDLLAVEDLAEEESPTEEVDFPEEEGVTQEIPSPERLDEEELRAHEEPPSEPPPVESREFPSVSQRQQIQPDRRRDEVFPLAVQVAAFRQGDRGIRERERLAALGFPADTVWVTIPHRGRWCRVVVGSFHQTAEAESLAEQLRQHPEVEAVYIVTQGGRGGFWRR